MSANFVAVIILWPCPLKSVHIQVQVPICSPLTVYHPSDINSKKTTKINAQKSIKDWIVKSLQVSILLCDFSDSIEAFDSSDGFTIQSQSDYNMILNQIFLWYRPYSRIAYIYKEPSKWYIAHAWPYSCTGLFHLIVIHPHGKAIITSEGFKFMPF